MYSKDKTFNIHFRVSDNDYKKLIDDYNRFLEFAHSPISFSEYIRRRLLNMKETC